MKIGIVLSTCPGYSETFFKSKIKGLLEGGMEVSLFCQKQEEDFQLCPVILAPPVSSNPLLMGFYFIKELIGLLPYSKRMVNFLRLEKKEGKSNIESAKSVYLNAHLLKADLDWLHFGYATIALGSEPVAKAIDAKMAVSLRGFDIGVYPVKNPGCYRVLWRYVDKVHTISDDLLNLAYKQGLPDTVTVAKITPAINTEVFKAPPEPFDHREKPVFLTIGRLHWKKGIVHTLQALAMLKIVGFDFSYNIIGIGDEYERIAFAAYQLGLKENVQFLGKLPHDEVREELEKADIYLQHSIQEGFCNAVLEAQAMGKLCIVSNAEGLSENVLHGETGWVVPKNAPRLLAEQIKKVLLMTSEERYKISKNARRRVKLEFNLEMQGSAFLLFYITK